MKTVCTCSDINSCSYMFDMEGFYTSVQTRKPALSYCVNILTQSADVDLSGYFEVLICS